MVSVPTESDGNAVAQQERDSQGCVTFVTEKMKNKKSGDLRSQIVTAQPQNHKFQK